MPLRTSDSSSELPSTALRSACASLPSVPLSYLRDHPALLPLPFFLTSFVSNKPLTRLILPGHLLLQELQQAQEVMLSPWELSSVHSPEQF